MLVTCDIHPPSFTEHLLPGLLGGGGGGVHVLFPFLCNLQQYCDSAYNKLNSHKQKEFINITKINYIGKTNKQKNRRDTGVIQFQTKIQAIKWPSKQINKPNKKVLTQYVHVLYIVSPNIYHLWHSLYVSQVLVRAPFSYNLIMWHIQFCIIFVPLKVTF